MMYASFRNLPNFSRIMALCLIFGLCLCLVLLSTGRSYANQPYSTLDNSGRHRYGPDGKGESISGATRYSSGVDAYGNPIVPLKPAERKVPLERTLKKTAPTRPLPDLPETDAGWKF